MNKIIPVGTKVRVIPCDYVLSYGDNPPGTIGTIQPARMPNAPHTKRYKMNGYYVRQYRVIFSDNRVIHMMNENEFEIVE